MFRLSLAYPLLTHRIYRFVFWRRCFGGCMPTNKKTKEAADEELAAPVPPRMISFKWALMVVVLLFAVGGGGAFAWFKFMTPHKAEAKAGDAKSSEVKTEGKPGEQAGPTKMGPILDLDPFIVNLADSEPRFLKVTIKLE